MISLLITIAIAGFVVWMISLIPMPQIFRTIIFGFAALILILYALRVFGLYTGLPNVRLK